MDNFYYIKQNNDYFDTIYNKIKQNNDYIINIIENHGFGFYKLNKNNINQDNIPNWYTKINDGLIQRLIIKNINYISFNSTGFKLFLDLLSKRELLINNNKYIIPKNISIIIIVDEEWFSFFSSFIQKKQIQMRKAAY